MSPEAHSMSPVNVLRLVRTMGGTFGRIMLVGCEPEPLDPEGDGKMGLSEPVQAALDEAVSMIEDLVARLGNETAANVGV